MNWMSWDNLLQKYQFKKNKIKIFNKIKILSFSGQKFKRFKGHEFNPWTKLSFFSYFYITKISLNLI